MQTDSKQQTISLNEAAAMLDVSRETVRRLLHSGQLAYRRKTPSAQSPYLIVRDSVEAYIKRMMEVRPE